VKIDEGEELKALSPSLAVVYSLIDKIRVGTEVGRS
jgi:hypothetical protein